MLQGLEIGWRQWTSLKDTQNQRKSIHLSQNLRRSSFLNRTSRKSRFPLYRCAEKQKISSGGCLQEYSWSSSLIPTPQPSYNRSQNLKNVRFGGVRRHLQNSSDSVIEVSPAACDLQGQTGLLLLLPWTVPGLHLCSPHLLSLLTKIYVLLIFKRLNNGFGMAGD